MTIRQGLAIATAVLVLAACGEQTASDPNRTVRKGRFFVKEEVTQQGGFFYRLEAHYTVKETGEPIDFDIVVACNIRTTNYTYTGPSFVAERYPEVMAKATKDGHAVMIKTPRVCQQIELDRGYVPDDFVPFAIWFDDVNDLSFGWGYATQDAYDGPGAKIAYRPTDPATGTYTSKITRVSRAEWEVWREKAATEWVQIGALPGPWGYSDPKDKAGIAEEDRVKALNGGKSLGTWCRSMKRVPVDAQAVSSIETAAATNPGSYGTDKIVAYDVRFPDMVQAFVDIYRRAEKEPILGGYTKREAFQAVEGTLLRPPALGSMLREPAFKRPLGFREHFPRLSYAEPPYLTFKLTGYVKQILFGPEWTGFAACGFSSPKRSVSNDSDPRLSEDALVLTDKVFPVYLNDEILFENALPIAGNTGDIPGFLERNGHFWTESGSH